MRQSAAALIRSAAQHAAPKTAFWFSQLRRRHDEPELRLLPILVDRDREAIDVGANVGRYAYPTARIARHVHVFEPHPRLARMLKAGLPRNCTVHQAAVSDETASTVLSVPAVGRRWDEGLAYLGERAEEGVVHQIGVRTITLDAIADRPIGFVKIDVEGHEQAVLQGAHELFERNRPTVLVEAENRHREGTVRAVFDFFAANRYAGMFLMGSGLRPVCEFRPALQDPSALPLILQGNRRDVWYINNFVFVPEERRDLFVEAARDLDGCQV